MMQRRDQEMARPAAWVEHLQLRRGLRPAVEGARGRSPRAALAIRTAYKAQIAPIHARQCKFAAQFVFRRRAYVIIRCEFFARPPCTQSIVEQELHHVRLGEELRHRRNLIRTDLDLLTVDVFLLLALPELVYPSQCV